MSGLRCDFKGLIYVAELGSKSMALRGPVDVEVFGTKLITSRQELGLIGVHGCIETSGRNALEPTTQYRVIWQNSVVDHGLLQNYMSSESCNEN